MSGLEVAFQLLPDIWLLTQSIYRVWLCSKTVLPEYVSATGPRQKISIYVSVVHAHSLAAPC